MLSDGTAGYLSADSTLLAETAGSVTSSPLTDALGSVRAQTDSTGSISASATYGVDGDVRSSSGSVGALGYTGALSDASGLVYLNARSLDPGTGTFTSRDPETPGGPGVTGFNPYAYAGQNPTTYTDPSGREGIAEGAERIAEVSEPAATAGEAAGEEISGGIESAAEDMAEPVDAAPDPEPTPPEAGDTGIGGSGEPGGGGSGDIGEPPSEEPGGGGGDGGGGGSGGSGFSSAEQRISDDLADRFGAESTRIPEAPPETRPDALVRYPGSDEPVPTEFKTMVQNGANTLKNAIENANDNFEGCTPYPQGDAVIDAQDVGLTQDEAIPQIERALGNLGDASRLQRIIVFLGDGTVVMWPW